MLGKARMYRYFTVPIICAVSLFFVVSPVTFAATHLRTFSLVGPKKYYLALGDSLAFGYQPDLNFKQGYADDFFSNLKGHGVKNLANMGCPEETSSTFMNGGCPYTFLHKYFYLGAQLNAAVNYLHNHAGQVSPVTLDIGANDVLGDINTSNCTVSSNFESDLTNLDTNLTGTILPQLKTALTVKGKLTGDLVMMNYYDPYQNICPNSVSIIQTFNKHLKADVSGFGIIVNVFGAFGGAGVPNPNICTYTWMCATPPLGPNIHATDLGYSVIANTFAAGIPKN
jgi:lysophospholipase L1-like esterase